MRVIVRDHGRFERSVVLDILDNINHGFRAQPVPDGVSPGPAFAFLGAGTSASDRIAPVGHYLSERGHGLASPMALLSASMIGSGPVPRALDCLIGVEVRRLFAEAV